MKPMNKLLEKSPILTCLLTFISYVVLLMISLKLRQSPFEIVAILGNIIMAAFVIWFYVSGFSIGIFIARKGRNGC